MRSAVGDESQAAGFVRRGGDFGGGDGFEGFLHGLHHFDGASKRFAGNFAARCGRAVDGAQQHFFAAAAAGQQADADFDQSGIKFGVRLARRGMQRNFRAAAQAQAERRGHHRLRRELDGLRHPLELADGEVNVVPLFFLHAHEQQHEVGADGKICGVVGDDEGVEGIARARRVLGIE